MGDEMRPALRLELLSGFGLHAGPEPVPLIGSAQRLVAFLALHYRPLGRSYTAEMLWSETTTIRATANLRSSLWRTQRSCPRLIVASSRDLAISPEVVVDVQVAVGRAHRLIADRSPSEEDLSPQTRAALSVDLLPEWYDDWVLVERERYRQLRLHALESMCVRLALAGRYGEAIDAGLAAVRAEPLRESAHQALIRAHLAEGNRWEAVRQYEHCRRILLDELGLEPSEALHRLLPAPSQPSVDAGRRRQRARNANAGSHA